MIREFNTVMGEDHAARLLVELQESSGWLWRLQARPCEPAGCWLLPIEPTDDSVRELVDRAAALVDRRVARVFATAVTAGLVPQKITRAENGTFVYFLQTLDDNAGGETILTDARGERDVYRSRADRGLWLESEVSRLIRPPTHHFEGLAIGVSILMAKKEAAA